MKKILFATDYSESAVAAFRTASLLGSKLKAELHVLHVFEMTVSYMSTLSLSYAQKETKLVVENRDKLKRFCDEYKTAGITVATSNLHLEESSIASAGILKVADEVNAEIIIVGMHKGNRFREFFVGSTATNLIKKSPYPVLAIPEEFRLEELKSFVYATDFEETDLKAIKIVAEIAQVLKIPIKLVHISTEKEYAGQQQMEWFEEMLKEVVTYSNISFELVLSNDIHDALKLYLRNVDNAILVMLERENSVKLASLWQLDMVERMKLEKILPLLSFRKESLDKT